MNKPIKQTLLGVLKKLNYYELITRTLVFGLIIAFLRLDNKLNEEETYVFWCVLVFLIMMYLTFSGKLFIKEPQPEPKEEEPTNPEEIADRALQAKIKAFGLIKETVKNRFACSIQEVIA